jgi:cell division protein FtsB
VALEEYTMKTVIGVIAAVMLAGTITSAQSAPDIATLERKLQDAQATFNRASTPTAADEEELKILQDDLAYLRVKARRGLNTTSSERRELGVRIDQFAVNAQNRVTAGRERPSAQTGRMIPSGSELDVRLESRLYSDTAKVEDPVEATTVIDLYRGNDLIIPAGSRITGYVSSVDRASRTDRKGSLTVQFTRLFVGGRTHEVRAHVTQVLESSGLKGEAARIGAGAGVGAIIGGILGGVKGAIAGILIGGGGVIAATEGKDVDLPEGTILRVRFEDAVPLGR